MKVLHARCAGLDVHKELVVACARLQHGAKVRREQRCFDTTTKGLLELLAWLGELGCTHVAMEATGVYWKPVWHVLEGHVELVLANAAHIRNVPGRKSDMNDATWIADLLAHGLITASMIPPTPIQELRDLTRTRRQLVREIGQHTQRVQRVLEDANVKLSSVISDTLGVSGRRIVEAIIAGEDDPEKLAAQGSERLRCSHEELCEALRGRVSAHHRFLLRQHVDTIDHLQRTVELFEAQIAKLLEPFRVQHELLMTIPGVRETAAAALIAEIGVDMSRFPSAAHLVSWAGLCPRMDESAGKRRSTRLRKGAVAQAGARPVRLGRGAHQADVHASAVSSPQGQARTDEGRRGGCRHNPHGGLLHPPGRRELPRARSRPLRRTRPHPRGPAPRAADPGARL